MRKFVLLLLAALFAVSACGLGQTTPDQVAIRYSGGALFAEEEAFKECLPPSSSQYGDAGDKVYRYPSGQRTFKFSNDPGSDAPPMAITTQGGVVLTVSGTVTFTPQFQDCDRLRDFHERIGRKYNAYLRADDDASTIVVEGAEGWSTMLGTYVKDPTDRAIDDASLGYTWQQLTSDPAKKNEWEVAALAAIPQVMARQSGGEFFKVDSVILQKPEIPASLAGGVEQQERAKLNAEAANIDKATAEQFPGGIQGYLDYQQQQAVNEAIRNGSVQVIPIPQGSPVQVQVPPAVPR